MSAWSEWWSRFISSVSRDEKAWPKRPVARRSPCTQEGSSKTVAVLLGGPAEVDGYGRVIRQRAAARGDAQIQVEVRGDSGSPAAPGAQPAKPAAAAKTVEVDRAGRDPWTPVMDVLRQARAVTVTDAQLERLRELPLSAERVLDGLLALESQGSAATEAA